MDIIEVNQFVLYKGQKDKINMSFNQNESNKEHNKDAMSLIIAPGTKGTYVYVLKKLEKITSAIFLVTDLFPEKDTLRYKLRDASLELLSVAAHDQTLEHTKPYLLELLSLFDVAYHSNQFSEMNYSVLKREMSELIEKIQKDKYETFSIPSSFFNTPEQPSRPFEKKTEVPVLTDKPRANVASQGQKETVVKKTYLKTSNKKKNRQQKILDIIKDMKKVSATDLSKKIPGVSGKTIQRELIDLVERGIVKKEGERRWSMYSLA